MRASVDYLIRDNASKNTEVERRAAGFVESGRGMKALTKQRLPAIVGLVVGLLLVGVQEAMPWMALAIIGILFALPVFAVSSMYGSHVVSWHSCRRMYGRTT